MQALLRKMREERANDRGFTMIELLVVVVIIGVLVAIAIPLYLNYRKGAENKSAQSDVRGGISAVEQYYTDNANTYPPDATSGVGTNLVLGAAGTSQQTISVSPNNTIGFKTINSATAYVLCGQNADGLVVYSYNSSTGGTVKKASTQASVAACLTAGG